MLVLGRRPGQIIDIGPHIELKMLSFTREQACVEIRGVGPVKWLTLHRRIPVQITTDVSIELCDMYANLPRVGVVAPPNVSVLRREINEAKRGDLRPDFYERRRRARRPA